VVGASLMESRVIVAREERRSLAHGLSREDMKAVRLDVERAIERRQHLFVVGELSRI
jgi:hypothetical protein